MNQSENTVVEERPEPEAEVVGGFIAALSRCGRVLVTTHVRPDGDALGTTAALVLGMGKVGIDAEVLLLSRLPRKHQFLFEAGGVRWRDVEQGWPDRTWLDGFDALLVADTGTWSQLPGLRDWLGDWGRPRLVLDHHLTQEEWATHKLVVTGAAAAGEIAAALLDAWGIEWDAHIAAALFVALASDTGWFQFSNTRPNTLRLAARLLEAGADIDRLYQALYQNEPAERVALQTRAQQSLELLENGRLAVMQVERADFEQTHADVADTENLINFPLQVRSVEVSLLFVEPRDAGAIRVSLRSKGQVDVARFAEQFGGGGHARAAGLKLGLPLADAIDRITTAMIDRLRETGRKGD